MMDALLEYRRLLEGFESQARRGMQEQLVLPPTLTAEERAEVKRIVDVEFPHLEAKSFGVGEARSLHVFLRNERAGREERDEGRGDGFGTNSDPDDAPQRSHLAASAPAAPRSPQPDRGPDYESAAETPLELSFTAGSSSSTFRRGQQLSEIHTEQTPVQESESNAILDNVLAQGGVWTPSRGTPTAMFMSDSILAAAVHRPFFPEDSDTDNPQRENSVGGFDAEQTSGSVKSELERSLPKNYSKIRRVEGNTPEVGNSHASSSGLTNATNGVSGSASHLAGSGPAAEEHQHSSTTRSGHHHSHGKKHDRDLQASPAGGASSAASSRSLKAELLAKSAPAPHPGFGSGRAGFWREGVAIKNTFLHIEDISMWLSKL